MKTMMFPLLLALVLGFAPACRAQAPAGAGDPEAVAAELYARIKASDWKGAAALFDEDALKRFRGMLQPVVDAASASGQPGANALFDGADPASLKQAGDAEFFAAFMGGMMARLSSMGGGISASQILGSVPEGEDLRHVVTRTSATAMGIGITKMEVVSLRRRGGAWKVLLNGEIEGMAKAMQMLSASKQGAGAKEAPAPDAPPAPAPDQAP
ncbi:hypothetical protein [Luteimonas aquatica]|uniref:hypothetical protein n=1 Tax=Luteimonas aquatica TaxID=450364 RepID=UPI001F5AFFED|nr:hypothetical protein [Luteimonas aquatica]